MPGGSAPGAPGAPGVAGDATGTAGTAGGVAAPDTEHAIAPLSFRGPAPAAWAALLAVVAEWPRTHIVLQTTDYLHVEFTSLIFRFVDDVEFRLDAEAGVIQVRSASRIGYSDLGANRKRVEALRAALREHPQQGSTRSS